MKLLKWLLLRRSTTIQLIIVLFLLFLQELFYANIRNFYRNFYTETLIATLRSRRLLGDKKIAILTVLKDRANEEEYRLAQLTFECYAIYHRYLWEVIDLSSSKRFQSLCPHKDFMFRRHCVTAVYLSESAVDWLLFIDADMGVINPNRLIEEWIDENFNIIFYNRIFNYEIMAGSYLVRNTKYSREFLHFWADYEYKVPNSMHGTDNGAIQHVFLELLTPEKIEQRKRCYVIWNESKSFDDLFLYEACARAAIGNQSEWKGKAKILPKGSAWARDTWLTNSQWSPQDFVLHGWKKGKLNGLVFGNWPSPFVSHSLNLSFCDSTDLAAMNWKYKNTFIRSDEEIEGYIQHIISDTDKDYQNALKEVDKFLKAKFGIQFELNFQSGSM